MKSPNQVRQSESFWEKHVAQSEIFTGSAGTYCKAEGLVPQTFYRWRSRIKKRKSSRKEVVVKSPFVPVKVLATSPATSKAVNESVRISRLPDPQWVAEFILHLQGGLK